MQAYEQGETIEFCNVSNRWISLEGITPRWNWHTTDYRVVDLDEDDCGCEEESHCLVDRPGIYTDSLGDWVVIEELVDRGPHKKRKLWLGHRGSDGYMEYFEDGEIKDPNSWVDDGDIVSKGHKFPRGD